MKILVTGSTGFLGKPLTDLLNKHGFNACGLNESNEEEPVDITQYEQVKNALSRIRPDIIVHLAGLAFVLRDNPLDFYNVNVLGTENILNATLELNTAQSGLICTSTAGVYGQQNVTLLSENSATLPLNHYSISKLGMEMVVRKYQNDRPITVIRPFNIIGIGQNSLFLIPKIIKHYAEVSSQIELGNLTPIRDYLSASDFCRLILDIIQLPINNNTVNICTGVGHSVNDVLTIMSEISGINIPVKSVAQHARKDDIFSMVGDPTLLKTIAQSSNNLVPLKTILEDMYEFQKYTIKKNPS